MTTSATSGRRTCFSALALAAFDTNISRDDDRYFATLAREIGYEAWDDPARAPCHTQKGEKHVIQYPPVPASRFRSSRPVSKGSPYTLSRTSSSFLAAVLAICSTRASHQIVGSGVVGMAAIYFMVNPSKASYSMAPTMIVCAVVGLLTAMMTNDPRSSRRNMAAAAAGMLMGLAVSFRLPNLLLSAGYFLVLLAMAARSAKLDDVVRLALFGVAYLVGLVPTLVSNAINAGSVIATTYGSVDATPPDFSFSIARQYFSDVQGALILLVVTWSIVALAANIRKTAASIVAINIVVNLGFFLTHPISTPYYLMPLLLLSMWTLLFSFLNDSDEGRVRHARPRWCQRLVLPVLRLNPLKQPVVVGKPDSAWSCTRSQRPPTDVSADGLRNQFPRVGKRVQ